jgi:hypothetical protein
MDGWQQWAAAGRRRTAGRRRLAAAGSPERSQDGLLDTISHGKKYQKKEKSVGISPGALEPRKEGQGRRSTARSGLRR